MQVREVGRFPNHLPPDDDHPYRIGPWQPQLVEYDALDCDVIEGKIPADLNGVYLRNTENPVMPAIGRYHPFDGDGMLHAIRFRDGKADYRNRFVRTTGLAAELEAGEPLWAGIIESPHKSKRDGWGARGKMKDASSTDVVVHNGRALTSFYQCGDVYQHDPETLAPLGTAPWAPKGGVSAHTKLDPNNGDLLYFTYGTDAPYMHLGILGGDGAQKLYQPVPLPGPRLPHDICFTEHYAVLPDFPLFWDPAALAKGSYRPGWHPELPTRFAIVPRAGGEPRWFEAAPTYVLHWINAYEEGTEIVVDGYFQQDPLPRPDPADGQYAMMRKMVDLHAMRAVPHRWRFDLATGKTREERLFDDISEFPSVHYRRAGRKHERVWSMTAPNGWFLFDGLVDYDLKTGARREYKFPDGVYASESPMAPRSDREDDGYLLTFVTTGECQIFDAANIANGPVARVKLPERISSGTHACWSPM